MAWVKRTFKRDWLQKVPSLNCVSFRHELSNRTRWEIKPEKQDSDPDKLTRDDYYPQEQIFLTFELVFRIGSRVVKLHANRDIGNTDAIKDYIRKLEQMRSIITQFLAVYKSHYEMDRVFVLKEFLNSETGVSPVYTSMMAIGTSVTHDFFLDISSCEDKARLYESKEKEFVEILVKLSKFISSAITDSATVLAVYKERL